MKNIILAVTISMIAGCKTKLKIFPYEVGMSSSKRAELLNIDKEGGVVQSYPNEPNTWLYYWKLDDTVVQTKLVFGYEASSWDAINKISIDLATDAPGKSSRPVDTTQSRSKLALLFADIETKTPDSVCSYKKFQKIAAFLEKELGKPIAFFQAKEIPGNFLTPKVYLDTTLASFKFINGNESLILNRSYYLQTYRGEENAYYERAWIEIKLNE